MSTKKVELMAPMKNLQSLHAVLKYADAVYFGVESLNMRMFSDNFKLEDLPEIVKLCHENNVKAYLTTNVVIYENEFELLAKALNRAKESNIDAVIVHDIGAISLAKEKGLAFHISTQANISNSRSARFYEDLGAERVILARELSLEQIKKIKSKLTKAKVETFVHGAQCTSISGRCYFSAELCGSQEYSANRGRCVQPCRRRWRVFDDQNNELLYDGVFFINTKDLCMIEHVPQLIEAHIDAFKIEGRMRDPIYIEETAACYREAIDAYYDNSFTPEKAQVWLNRLKKVYNRGFSTGFYFGMPTGREIERFKDGNISEYRKKEIGKVLSYFPKRKAAKILLTKGKLKLNDEIIFIGAHTSTYLRQNITSIQIKRKKNLSETPTVSQGNPIAVGILVDRPVKKNDRVFRLIKKK
ncbi:MAG: U32 family peptidase [Candidatus Lokiarchaeota archaeon]|nr:U32 family peptidase [Candidatus Lokiarchaeota archaeon]MBD3338557.1 U32 family peptidase [Candidatus Lokiarchaeota archaeon]